MPIIKPLLYSDGSNSFSDFLNELKEKHKNERELYIKQLIDIKDNFEIYGPQINQFGSKNSPPYKNLNTIYKGLGELRTKKCRYFIYNTGKNGVWIGLHGYEKQSNDIPKKEIKRAKEEIKLWKNLNK